MSLREMWLEEGIQKGEIIILRRQLSRRFGAIPAWTEDRLNQAEEKDLEIWSDRILEANTLDEIFDGSGA